MENRTQFLAIFKLSIRYGIAEFQHLLRVPYRVKVTLHVDVPDKIIVLYES